MASIYLRRERSLVYIALISAIAVFVTPFIGVVDLTSQVAGSENLFSEIFWSLRVPRVLLAFFCGATLGVGGLVFQSMLRNPLATPYTLGVASGASCGAVVSMLLVPTLTFAGTDSSVLGGLGGAAIATLLVYILGSVGGALSMGTLLLAGVAMSFFFSSLILLFQYLGNPAEVYRVIRWLMGGLETVGYHNVALAGVFAAVMLACSLLYLRELDSMAIDNDLATSWGVPVRKVQKRLFVATSISIGGMVSITGPIGFIGIMLPHMCRMIVGPKMTLLLPATATCSGAFLVLCDAAARTVAGPAEVPVGIITALLGGPFFVWILLGARQH